MGGMAELFIATAPGEHGFTKKVVIKRLLPHLTADDTYKNMFIDEAKLTARLVHPKIAQTFELGKVEDLLYIAMEYVDGIDVLALLREFAQRRRRVDHQLAAWIAHEVLDALDYAHNLSEENGNPLGIVHRDISPSNVLMSLRGDIKLVDFGIARAKDPDRAHKSKSGTLKGKYGYMSPEQVIEMPLDGRSDVFSVGVVLAELLTGRRLFAAANELDVLLMVRDAKLGRFEKYGADIEPGLANIVRKALKKSVDERWSSAAAFRDGIAEWLFEHRHRMTNKHVADVVAELRDSVQERRARTVGDAGMTAVLEEPVRARAPSDDGIQISVDTGEHGLMAAGDSMPNIQIAYDSEEQLKPPARPISVSDLAAQAAVATASAAVVTPAKRVDSGRTRPPPVQSPAQPARAPSPTPPPRTPAGSAPPVSRTSSSSHDGIVEIPMGDTISAAVEAIVLSDNDDDSDTELVFRAEEDSVTRAFDDLTEEPASHRSKDVVVPTQEELARKKPPTPPALADIADPPDDAGDFNTTSPLRVLFRLMTARATGLLVVAIGGIKKEIYVRDGQPEYVSSNVASELFGNYLVTKGVVSAGELAMALAMMPHYGGKLGDTLVGLGLLKPLEVFRHLTRQVRTKIIDVCTWNKGGFAWYAGRENPREAFPLDFNAFEILGAGAMTVSDDVIDAWVARQGTMKLRASRTRRVGPERFEVKELVALFESLDGKRSITDLVEANPDRNERLRMGRMLYLLESCDLARAQ
ncbi:MAG: serine/threonine protein kinase [Myxococcales bacterium]|nr:serine/threonine protein kinase [Myxococcales bacterium]